MVPKKSKDLILPTALQLNLDPELVGDVIGFYFIEVRKAINGLKAPRVTVPNLGTFATKHWKLQELEDKYQEFVNNLNNLDPAKMTFQKHGILNAKMKGLEQVQDLRKLVAAEDLRKQEHRKARHGTST